MYRVFVEFCYISTSALSRMSLSDWLHHLLSIVFQIVSGVAVSIVDRVTAASLRCLGVCGADLDEVWND